MPDAEGLTVRNLVVTRRVPWGEVADVRFDDGAPWVTIDLTDDDELAVMAIQRADGETARAEARRLGSLVARHRAGGRSADGPQDPTRASDGRNRSARSTCGTMTSASRAHTGPNPPARSSTAPEAAGPNAATE